LRIIYTDIPQDLESPISSPPVSPVGPRGADFVGGNGRGEGGEPYAASSGEIIALKDEIESLKAQLNIETTTKDR